MNSNKNIPQLRFPGFKGEWEEVEFGSILEESLDKTTSENEDVLLSSAIDGLFLNTELFTHFRGQSNIGYRKVKKYMLILSAQNLHLGNANVNLRFEHGIVSPAYKVYYIHDCNPVFLAHWVKRDETKAFFLNATTSGASVCRKNIVWKELYKQTIFLPKDFSEQMKIADCLSEMDNLIAAQGQKVEALKEKKRGMMQQMFPQQGETTPRLRFPGFAGEWEEKKMSDVFIRRTEKNAEDNKNVLTISAQYGLISQLDFFKKSVSASDVTGYYLLHKGDFAYNKSSSQGKPVGAIKPLKLYDKGVVSTLYICFRCNDTNAVGFWEQYFDAGIFDKEIMSIAQEGARNHGLLNVPTSDFFELIVKTPQHAEQQKIAECLSAMDEMIASESAKLDALKDHKKGLMQQLFPQPNK